MSENHLATNHADIEPELLGRLPRKVRRRKGSGNPLGCVQLFILPHTLVGIIVLLATIYSLFILCCGTDASGAVTGQHTAYSHKGRTTYHINFRYSSADRVYYGSVQVPMQDFAQLTPGSTLPLKLSPVLPGFNAQALPYSWGNLGFLAIFSLFWNAIMAIFIWGIYLAPFLAYRVVIVGVPVRGVITKKKVSYGKTTTYTLRYQYQPQGMAPRTGNMSMPHAQWEGWHEGDSITVLYLARHPWFSVLYPCSAYQAVGAHGAPGVEIVS